MVAVLLLYFLFASTFTFGKAALTYIQPVMFIGIRMTAAGLLLLGYQYLFNRSKWRLERQDLSTFAQVSFFLMFLSFIAEFWSLQYVTAAKACLLYNLSPFVTALLSLWLLGERLTAKQWIGLGIGMLGFIPILMGQLPTEAFTRHIGFLSSPELVLLVAVTAACYGWIITQQLVVTRGYPTIMVNGVSMVLGGVLAVITALIFEKAPWLRIPPQTLTDAPVLYAWTVVIGYTILLILVANVICFNLYSSLLRIYSATFISFVGFTTPLFAAFFDLLYFGQWVSTSFFVTIAIVGVGIYLFYQDELKKRY